MLLARARPVSALPDAVCGDLGRAPSPEAPRHPSRGLHKARGDYQANSGMLHAHAIVANRGRKRARACSAHRHWKQRQRGRAEGLVVLRCGETQNRKPGVRHSRHSGSSTVPRAAGDPRHPGSQLSPTVTCGLHAECDGGKEPAAHSWFTPSPWGRDGSSALLSRLARCPPFTAAGVCLARILHGRAVSPLPSWVPLVLRLIE
jgi:hypothetical protein